MPDCNSPGLDRCIKTVGGAAGSEELDDDRFEERYRALCDPRLNAQQSLELAFELGEMLQG